jgi:predicted kinase
MRPFAILMNGYTASLKTYTSRRIANVLKIPILETNRFGHCTKEGYLSDGLRNKRYDIMLKLASFLSTEKLPMVLDGTFNFQHWRSSFYSNLYNNEIIIVRCICNDRDIINARIREREQNSVLPENEAAKMENYLKTLKDDEPVYDDVLPSGEIPIVIEFDTGNYTVQTTQGENKLAQEIKDIIWRSFHTGKLNEH